MKILKRYHVIGRGQAIEIELKENETLKEKDIIEIGSTKYIVKELEFWRKLDVSGSYICYAFIETKSMN